MADGNHIEVARAFVTIVPSMEGSQKTIATEFGAVVEPAAKETGEKSGKALGESLAKGLKTTAAVIGATMAAATAGAIATGKAFINAANGVSEYGDAIDKNSQKMGISAEAYQEWDYILKRNGASIDGMKTSMLKLTQAAESGNKAFKDLGISEEDLASMSKDDLFAATIKGLQNIQDEGQRTVIANKILGKGATELGALLNSSAEDTEALRQQVHDLGGIMSNEAVKSAATYQDELLNMKTALTGVKNNLMSQFLPGISAVMNGLSQVFGGNSGGIEQIRTGLQSVVTNITNLAPQFFSLASTIVNGILQGFAPMVPQLVSSIFGFLQTGLLTLASLMPQLTPVISEGVKGVASALLTCLPVLIDGVLDMTKELVTWLASGDNVKIFADGIFELISTIAGGLADALPILLPAVVNIVGQIAQSLTEPKNIKLIVNAALQIVGAVVVALVKALPEIGGVIVKLSTNVLSLLKDLGHTIVSNVGPWFSSVLAKLGTFTLDILKKLGELPAKAIEAGKNLIQGLIKGITDAGKKAVDTVKNLGKNIVSGLKNVLGIHSPSKVFEQLGVYSAEGFVLGYADTMSDFEADASASMAGLTASMSADITAHGTVDGALAGSGSTYTGGAVTINVYGAEGQNVSELAQIIAVKLQDMTARKGAVYA